MKSTVYVIAGSLFAAAVYAQPPDHAHCGATATVYVQRMGVVDETILQDHITAMASRMDQAKRFRTRSDQHRKALEQHMEDMQAAMQKLHEGFDAACLASVGALPPEQRLDAMERRMQTLQSLMAQMLEHQHQLEGP